MGTEAVGYQVVKSLAAIIVKTPLSIAVFSLAIFSAAFAIANGAPAIAAPNDSSNTTKLNVETPTADPTPIPAPSPSSAADSANAGSTSPSAPATGRDAKTGKMYKLGSQLQGGVEQKIIEPLDALKKIDNDVAKLNNQAKSLYHESTKDTAVSVPGEPGGTVGVGFVLNNTPQPTFDPGYFPPNPYKVSRYVAQIENLTNDLQQDLDNLNIPKNMVPVVHPQVQEIKQLMDLVVQHKANLHGLQKSWELNNAMLAGEAQGIQYAIKQIKKDCKVIKDVIQGKPPSGIASSS